MMSHLPMFTEQLEEAQTTMILNANKSHRPHNFKLGDSVFLQTKLLLISYAYVT